MDKTLLRLIYDELKYLGKVETQREFAEKLDVNEGYLSRLLKSNEQLPYKVRDILSKLFAINQVWLSSNGKELSMFAKDSGKTANEAHPVPYDDFMEAPYLPITAQAGYAKGFGDNSQPETLETKLVPKEFEKGNYLVIEIAGDSMDDG